MDFPLASRLAAALAFAAGFLLAHDAPAQGWKPEPFVEIVVGAGPGGGNDNTARTVQALLQTKQLVRVPVNVVNRPGAGGAIAFGYLNQHQGQANYLGVTSNTLLTNHITGTSPLSQGHFTPLAILIHEYLAFNVRTDSPIRDGKDLVARLRKDPGEVVLGISSALGNINHISFATVARGIGVDPKKVKTVVFKSSSESITALLGGHVDLVVGPSSIAVRYLETKQLRVVAITSAKRRAGSFAAVPTWTELGVQAVTDNWRGVIGVKGMTAQAVAYWDAVFRRLYELPEWKSDVEKNYWTSAALLSKESAAFLDAQYEELKSALVALGMTRTEAR